MLILLILILLYATAVAIVHALLTKYSIFEDEYFITMMSTFWIFAWVVIYIIWIRKKIMLSLPDKTKENINVPHLKEDN